MLLLVRRRIGERGHAVTLVGSREARRPGSAGINSNITAIFAQIESASPVVMPAHSASKTRVNALVSRASTSCFLARGSKERRGWPGQARP
jgi:hypothetical protein